MATFATITGNAIVAGFQFVCWCIHHEMSKLATKGAESSHLPVDPVKAFLALGGIGGDKFAVFLSKVLHDRRRLEQTDRHSWS